MILQIIAFLQSLFNERPNNKKILCCTAQAAQYALTNSVNSQIAENFIVQADLLVQQIGAGIGQMIPFPTDDDLMIGFGLAANQVTDAMGRKAETDFVFSASQQTAIDNFVEAAEAVFLVK